MSKYKDSYDLKFKLQSEGGYYQWCKIKYFVVKKGFSMAYSREFKYSFYSVFIDGEDIMYKNNRNREFFKSLVKLSDTKIGKAFYGY